MNLNQKPVSVGEINSNKFPELFNDVISSNIEVYENEQI